MYYICSCETAVSEMGISELKKKRMRFFDRTEEIASLKEILELSKSNAQFIKRFDTKTDTGENAL